VREASGHTSTAELEATRRGNAERLGTRIVRRARRRSGSRCRGRESTSWPGDSDRGSRGPRHEKRRRIPGGGHFQGDALARAADSDREEAGIRTAHDCVRTSGRSSRGDRLIAPQTKRLSERSERVVGAGATNPFRRFSSRARREWFLGVAAFTGPWGRSRCREGARGSGARLGGVRSRETSAS